MNSLRIMGCALLALGIGVGCSAPGYQMPDSAYAYSGEGPASAVQSESGEGDESLAEASPSRTQFHDFSDMSERPAPPSSAQRAPSPGVPTRGEGAPPVDTSGGQAATSNTSVEGESAPKEAPLLIYNGTVLLALYDVAETQKTIIKLVEGEGGWVSTRSGSALVLRVPAARFRDMLDQLAKMGDLLDLRWQAEDVTTAVRDTRIRLDSALKMRARLEELLVKAEDVKDALAIEQQLARVILEIERLQASIRGYQDRIAYSTINVEFRAKTKDEVPVQEYSLPYYWLQELGVNRLLQIPRR